LVYAWAGLDSNPPIRVSLHSKDNRWAPMQPAISWMGSHGLFARVGLELRSSQYSLPRYLGLQA
jgi:hypothetical protein